MYYNYKHFFSINLLAVTDANYKFITVDIGSYGKDSDGGVLSNSKFLKCIENNSLIIPKEEELPNSNIIVPYVFIGDEAFPLRNYLMRPFPRNQLQDQEKAVFNYNLSRARMTVECSFGIAAAKLRILNKPIETSVDKATKIVQAIAVLHNIIIDFEDVPKEFNGFVDTDGIRK
ncbi:protein ALP1-like [Myzus persicae]|uniref:protein ALP1-like n=1 Tax=Myzus persicae TaxID=13164 RepID=UPI000B939490|nr:protein ALP1-like [Myzus persicae]